MKVIPVKDFSSIRKMSDVNLFMLAKSNSERLSLTYYNDSPQEEKQLIEGLYNLFNKGELQELDSNLSESLYNFKNWQATNSNWDLFFENEVLGGIEDVRMMFTNVEKQSGMILRTSDYGVSISYFRNQMSSENVEESDKKNILEATALILLASNQLEMAEICKLDSQMRDDVKDSGEPETIINVKKSLKF